MGDSNRYIVTARKWRPLRFADVSSQEFITTTLKNSVKNNRVSHAYLFCGPRGVGKTTVARILAKAINCEKPGADGEPCNECRSCEEINNDNRNHPDVFEIDGASNRNIDDVRELREKVKYGPIRSRHKVFIIDEVHMLTGASFNALLKTLEEPPQYIVFIFATTAPEKVPLTILGRCQKFDFKRLSTDEIIERLRFITDEEKIEIDDESLFFIAKKGDGSMRDAQGLLDMATAYCSGNISFEQLRQFFNLAESDIYFEILDYIKNKDSKGLLVYFDGLIAKGHELNALLQGLQEHIRNLLVVKSTDSANLLVETELVRRKYLEYAQRFSEIELINSLKLIIQTESTFRYSSNQRILLEVLLVELIKFADTKELSELIQELGELKKNDKTREEISAPKTLRHKETLKEDADAKVKVTNEKVDETDRNVYPAKDVTNDSVEYVGTLSGGDDPAIQWEIVKEKIKSEKRWVYSLVRNLGIEMEDDNVLCVKIGPVQYDMLAGFTDYVASKVQDVFGSEQKFRFAKAEDEKNKENFNRICEILIKEFGGKEVG
jgi:DNA polymerase-3 subunit gamma/tau